MKKCSRCGSEKPKSEFGLDRHKFDGLRPECKECRRSIRKMAYKNNPEPHRQRAAAFRKTHPGYNKKSMQDWYVRNLDLAIKRATTWNSTNKKRRRSISAKNRAARLNRAPPWLTSEHVAKILDFYAQAALLKELTGEVWHVDHIVPLCGKRVSGLHVPWNLQILPANINIKKGNKYAI